MQSLLKIGDRVKLEADLSDLSAEFAGTVVAVKETVPFLEENENPNQLGVLFDNKKSPAIGRMVGDVYVKVVTKCKKI